MHNDLNQTTQESGTFAQWLARALRHAADLVGPETAKRQTIVAIKSELAYAVQISLLDAEGDLERSRHTVAMLRERLERLNHDPRHPGRRTHWHARR